MSLKHILSKWTASMIIVYMLFGNILITGTEVGKIIAQDLQTPDILIECATQKYVQYNTGNSKGTVLQEKIAVSQQCTKETYLPVQRVQLEIEVPKINEVLPSRINIIGASTVATNGKEQGEISQNYDSTTGLLSISYENSADHEGKIYSEYKENAKDEFEIIYIYPQEAYVENEEVEIIRKINVNMDYKTENDIITAQKEATIKSTQKENIGEIANYEIVSASEVYKGYLYANEENGTNYETTYQTKANLSILNNELIDEIKIELEKSSYISKNDEAIIPTDTIEYQSSKLSEEDFYKLFGQDGYLDFYIENTKYATIRYAEVDENGNRSYETIYYTEEKENIEAGKVEYPEGTTNVTIVTSKPQTEGNITIENEKKITVRAEDSVRPAVSELKAIREVNKIETNKKEIIEQEQRNENGEIILDENGNAQKEQITQTIPVNSKENVGMIELKEPSTQISMELSNNNFSTLTINRTTLTIKLNDTNSSCDLFESGTMEITLPDNLTSAKIINAHALYTNGLKITNAKIENGKIILDIEGKQTTYDTENINGGVNIVIDLELDIEDTVANHDEKMVLSYGRGTATVGIHIFSRYGLLNYTNLSGYNENETITAIDETEKIGNVDVGDDTKQVKLSATLVNNYNTDLADVEIIGKLPAVGNKDINGNDIGSNMDTTLLTTISVDDNEAQVYYSEAEDASSNSNSWTTTATQNSVAYKIELSDDTLQSKEEVHFEYEFAVPANLTYNKKAVTTYNVAYNLNGIEQNTVSTLTLATAEIPEIEAKIEPNIDLDYVTGGQIVEYDITLENKSNDDVSNLSIQVPIPEEQIYSEYTNSAFEDYVQGGYLPNASVKNKEYNNISLKAGEKLTKKIFLKIKDISEEKTVSNVVNVLNGEGNTIATNQYTTIIKPRQIILENVYSTTNTNLVEGQPITYMIYVENNSNEEKKNIKIIDQLDEDLEIEKIEDYLASVEEETQIPYELTRNNQVEFALDNLQAGDSRLIAVTVRIKNNTQFTTKEIGNKVRLTANGIYDHESEIAYYNVKGFLPSIEITSTSETNIKEYEQINYTITVQNNSEASKQIKIVDEFPNEINPESYELYVYDRDNNQIDNRSGTLGNQKVQLTYTIDANEKIVVHLTGTINNIGDQETVEVSNKAILYYGGYSEEDENYIYKTYIESNSITNVIEKSPNQPEEDDGMVNVEDPEADDIPEYNPGGDNNPGEDNNPGDDNNPGGNGDSEDDNNQGNNDNPGDNNTPGEDNNNFTYTIRGRVWIDSNKNGQRDEGENGIANVNVWLINNNGNIVLDSNSNQITTHTSEDGSYLLEKIPTGSYLVAFEYDNNTYTVTSYQKQGIDDNVNSDAIRKEMAINGEPKVVAVTDTIEIENAGKSNIDVGLIENAKFDLSLNKQINSITVTNATGTKTTTYNNQNFAKIDLVAKYMNNTNLIITYEFVIKNEGDVSGYVGTLMDSLPSGLEFNSELNKDWYKDSDGNLYTNTLSGIEIQPGGTSTVELVLIKKTTENTTGTFTNHAELTQISNIEAIEEQTNAKENNRSSADLVISIKTGSAIMYVGITLLCITIIGLGIFMIKKKILDQENENGR